MIDRAKRTFCRYPCRTISKEWKDILRRLQIHIIMNTRLKTTAGTAEFVKLKPAHKLFPTLKDYPPVIVDNVFGYLIVEINPKLVVLNPPNEVYDTISHELAHCLDFVIRGCYGRSEIDYHDEFWSFLHKRMGGNGKRFIEKNAYDFQLKRVAKDAVELANNFNHLDNTNM
jgi:hypothetical protein